ncbi:MAG: hypothetical protein V4522_18430 [Pseudomonadota bacterium]
MPFLVVAAVLLAAAPMAHAQNTPEAKPLPGLDDFNLPSSRPRPAVPTPEPTVSGLPRRDSPADRPSTERVQPPLVVPTERATPAARPTAAPRATPIPTPTPTPIAAPTPVPASEPTSLPTVAADPAPVESSSAPTALPAAPPPPGRAARVAPSESVMPAIGLGFGGVALVLALGALGWWWWRRREADRGDRRRDRDHEIFLLHPAGGDGGDSVPPPPEVKEPVAPPPQTPPAPTPFEAAPDTRALIEVTLVPKRAGTNVLSAAVDYTIVVQNAGDSAATGIRLDVRLLSAGTQQDAQIAAVFAAPIAQPITAPFDLPPGATVELGGMAMQPKQTLEPLDVAGKVLFVPVLTVNLTYDWVGGSGQTARSYVIGIDRGATAKLQPFRLDAPPRMYDTVAALPYPIAETR